MAKDLYPARARRPCQRCHRPALLSRALGVCVDCIRTGDADALGLVLVRHRESRAPFDLPLEPPEEEGGVPCPLCVNRCRLPRGGVGYCRMRKNEEGKLRHLWGTTSGLLEWYYDPLPTNCVAAWVCRLERHCPGGKDLAVFFRACSFNCLFCQNWSFKDQCRAPRAYTAEELAGLVDERTACVCYFGGDPSPQAPFSILASRKLLARGGDVRICWETNGSENPQVMETMAELALRSGGIVKIDFKAHNPYLHRALTGSSNEWTLENIMRLSRLLTRRPGLPVLSVSTPLVPGYIDAEEVRAIARFLRCLDPDIPYSLLAFHPQFLMGDLPPTSRAHAEACYRAALGEGLRQVRVGNIHLLE